MWDRKDGLTARQEIWIRAWCSVARSSNCNKKSSPVIWADDCLEKFDERFPIPPNSERE